MTGRVAGMIPGGPSHIANFDEALVDAIEDNSDVQSAILSVNKNKGWYATSEALNAAYPTGSAGFWAIVGATDTVWIWDTDGNVWVDSGLGSLVTSVNGEAGDVVLDAGDVGADPAGSAAGVLATSCQKASNLSDLANKATSRSNLGLGTAATQASTAFDATGSAAGVLGTSVQKASNLSDLADAGASRTNLGLGTMATATETDYAKLAGRSGGQTLQGGTGSGENLTLQSTAHGTKGKIIQGAGAYDEVNGRFGVDNQSPTIALSLSGTAAKTIGQERNTSGGQAGNNLTLQSAGAASGASNKYSGTLILQPGASTGQGTATTRMKRYTRTAGSSTADNTTLDAIVIPAHQHLTNNSVTTLFTVPMAANTTWGGFLIFAIECTDGTNLQVHAGHSTIAAVNKAGVYTTQITDEPVIDDANALSSGTLADTWSIATGTNEISIQLNANSSLTPTVLKVSYTLFSCGSSAAAISTS